MDSQKEKDFKSFLMTSMEFGKDYNYSYQHGVALTPLGHKKILLINAREARRERKWSPDVSTWLEKLIDSLKAEIFA